jgi:hypothetical protein
MFKGSVYCRRLEGMTWVSILLSIGPVLLSILVSIAKSILTHSRYENSLDWSGFQRFQLTQCHSR